MQPRFEGIHDPLRYPDGQPMAPLGTVLLGYPTNLEGLTWRVPQPVELGHNGTFNAFRVLKQDVAGFEEYLDEAASFLLDHPLGNVLLPPAAEAKICQVLQSMTVMVPCANSSPPICAAGGAMARRWPCRRMRLIPQSVRRILTTLALATPAAPMAPISAGATREAGRSCNG